jgi:hypothetical protein
VESGAQGGGWHIGLTAVEKVCVCVLWQCACHCCTAAGLTADLLSHLAAAALLQKQL